MKTLKDIPSKHRPRQWLKTGCMECHKPLLRYPSELNPRKYGSFCDRLCLGKFRTKHLTHTKAANFKTGAAKDRKYIKVQAPWHPNKVDRDYVYLHRIVAEARLGRFLLEKEIVHHKDGNPLNNHWNNLEVMTQSEHIKEHREEMDRRKK